MCAQNASERYGSLQIILHWVTLLLIVLIYASMELRGYFPKGSSTREAMKAWHFMLGLSVLILTAIRLVVALLSITPSINPTPARWQAMAARGVHWALYAFLIAMPVLGWLVLSLKSKTIPFFGLELPPLAGANSDLAERVQEVHETIGTLGYALIGIHAAAALAHHYILRDDTLKRMLPRRR